MWRLYLFAALDELFNPNIRGNYTDARYHALLGYVFELMREISEDTLAPEPNVSREAMVKLGRWFAADPSEVVDYISQVDLMIDEYRALEGR